MLKRIGENTGRSRQRQGRRTNRNYMRCFEAIEAGGLGFTIKVEGDEFRSAFENFLGAIIAWLKLSTKSVVANENTRASGQHRRYMKASVTRKRGDW